MATIDSRGFVDDGTGDLTVSGATRAGSQQLSATTLDGTSARTVTTPGFYYVAASGTSGQGAFTGSVPAASSFPGSLLFFTDTLGTFNWLLTGSSYAAGKAVFTHKSGSLPGALAAAYGGTSINMSPFGSIAMCSDGYRWCIMAGTGSMTLAGLNL